MAKKFINESLAVGTSTALREVLGTEELIDPETWPEKIRNLKSGKDIGSCGPLIEENVTIITPSINIICTCTVS